MIEVFRNRKQGQLPAAHNAAEVRVLATRKVQPRTERSNLQITGSTSRSRQAVDQSSQAKLRQLMETQKAPGASTTAPAKENVVTAEDQKLVVGPGIRVQGDVTNCDALIIEGYFEGSAKSRIIQIARGGTVSGDVEVDTAEISGDFDGTLTVSNRLTVRSTGRVTGTVRYFAVEIDSGGQISGDIQVTDEGMTGSAETEDQTNSGTSGKLEAAS